MRIPDLFRTGEPVYSFEFFLPKSEADMERFKDTVRALKLLRPGFVTMTYGAGGGARERTVETAGIIKGELGLETAAHLTCVAHTPAEIAALLDRIRSYGIENIVALRGDLPKEAPGAGDAPGAIPHAVDLVRLIRSHGGFSVAVAAYPEKHPESPSPEEDLRRFREKTEAGADWAITQLFFDNSAYFDFVSRARAAGVSIPIVPGIMPVTNFKQLQKFTAMCGTRVPEPMLRTLEPIADDPQAVLRYGIDYAVRQCRELLQRGAPGIHFYTLNRSHATATILERLRAGG